MEFFSRHYEAEMGTTLQKIIETPFIRLTYTDAVKELARRTTPSRVSVSGERICKSEHENTLPGRLQVSGDRLDPKEIKRST